MLWLISNGPLFDIKYLLYLSLFWPEIWNCNIWSDWEYDARLVCQIYFYFYDVIAGWPKRRQKHAYLHFLTQFHSLLNLHSQWVMPIKKPKHDVAVISASAERGHYLEDVPVKHKILTALRESMSPIKIETVINLQFLDRFFLFFSNRPSHHILIYFLSQVFIKIKCQCRRTVCPPVRMPFFYLTYTVAIFYF